MNIKSTVLYTVLFLFFILPAQAQTPFTVYGQVFDATNTPVNGATVSLSVSGGTISTITTAATQTNGNIVNGYYYLDLANLPVGVDAGTSMTLIATTTGKTASIMVARAANEPQRVDLSLSTSTGTDMVGIYRNGVFYLRNSNSAGAADLTFQYGPGSLTALAGDYNGDRVDTVGVYNADTGIFYLKNSNSAGAADLTFRFGPGGSDVVPLVGDWDGDGITEVGVYQKSTGTFFLKNSNSAGAADITVQFGPVNSTDIIPLAGDWDGDRITEVGVYQKSTGTFFLKYNSSAGAADLTFQFGPGGSDVVPLAGDWDGDGITEVGVYQKSTGTFFLKYNSSAGAADLTFRFGPGGSDVVPVVGDWIGK